MNALKGRLDAIENALKTERDIKQAEMMKRYSNSKTDLQMSHNLERAKFE